MDTSGDSDCQDCGEPYWYDFVVADEVWQQIAPRQGQGPGEGGILCAHCIKKRCEQLGVEVYGQFHFAHPAVDTQDA